MCTTRFLAIVFIAGLISIARTNERWTAGSSRAAGGCPGIFRASGAEPGHFAGSSHRQKGVLYQWMQALY